MDHGRKHEAGEFWVFGDYRDYLKNRVTLELLAQARDLAEERGTRCAAALIGHSLEQYIMEYIAHGAQAVYVMDAPHFAHFGATLYTKALCHMVETFAPEILLIGGTDFGLEFAPRVAKRLGTGLSAECIDLSIDPQEGLLIQTAPAFGGRLVTETITPHRRPQMATVRPGTFKERPHEYSSAAEVIYVEPLEPQNDEPLELIHSERVQDPGESLEEASIIICGGRGMGDSKAFEDLYRLAELLDGRVGGTRPAMIDGWISEDQMIGQTGRNVSPKVLITCGTSGAIQYTSGIQASEFIIAIDRDPEAPIFQSADLGIIGDAREIVSRLIQTLNSLREKEE